MIFRVLKLMSPDPSPLVSLMENYFEKIGDKVCCFEDLKPYLGLSGDELLKWTSFLESIPASFVRSITLRSQPCLTNSVKNSSNELRRLINAQKLLRYNLTPSELTVEAETNRMLLYAKYFIEGLPLGSSLPSSELQPADDLALLAGNALINLWKLSADEGYLHTAAALLEFALTKSQQSFQARLILIRIYRLLGRLFKTWLIFG